MKVEIIANNDENFILNPKGYAEIQPEPLEPEEVVEALHDPACQCPECVPPVPIPEPPAPPSNAAPLYNKVESMKWL